MARNPFDEPNPYDEEDPYDESDEDDEDEDDEPDFLAKEAALSAVRDLVEKLLDDDRLPDGTLEELVQAGELTIDDLVEQFKQELELSLP